jgi:hypothetical protein
MPSDVNFTSEWRERMRVLSHVVAIAMAAVALALFWQTPGHSWGDDFAGYLMQAKALLRAAPAQEVELNGRLMAASDWRTGPDAYPWGYPAILALIIRTVGQNLATLKLVSIASIGVVTLAAGLLACASRLSLLSAACVAILIGMQPDVTSLGNAIGSDALFLALTAVALLFAVRALDAPPNRSSPASRVWPALIAAVLAALSFFVRSNGAVTLIAIAASLAAVPLFAQRQSLRTVAATIVPFVLVGAALIVAYFVLLPDGNMSLAEYLSVEPSSLLRRSNDAFVALGHFIPIVALPAPLEHLGAAVIGVLAVVGAFRLGRPGFLLALFAVGHLLLVTLFPFGGGQRYYLPVLLAVVVLAVGGVEALAERAATRFSGVRDLKAVRAALVAVLVIGATASNLYRFDQRREKEIDGPYSAAATELFQYVRQQPTEIQPVGFFKPRAMRLLAGKEAILVREIGSAERVNSIAIDRAQYASTFQLSERQVAALQDFRPAFRNAEFTFYVRQGHQHRASSGK